MPTKPILINGKNYDWLNLTVVVFGVPVIGITAVNYAESQDSVNNYGAGGQPTGYGNKNVVYDGGSLVVYREEIEAMRKTAPNKSILNIPPFTITIMFSGDGVVFTTHKLRNCRFTKDEFAGKQGDTMLTSTLPFAFAQIDRL